jgi:hypothetical protein
MTDAMSEDALLPFGALRSRGEVISQSRNIASEAFGTPPNP